MRASPRPRLRALLLPPIALTLIVAVAPDLVGRMSPHRSEGFGLPLAEAFMAGVPALATGWSGLVLFILGLLPGPFLTDRLRSGLIDAARKANRPFDEFLAERASKNPTGRVGDPFEFGEACAFLCAASSGFIVGQNLLLDGGAFNSTTG